MGRGSSGDDPADDTPGAAPAGRTPPRLSGHRHLPGHVRRQEVPPVPTPRGARGPSRDEVEAAAREQRRRRRRWWGAGAGLAVVAATVVGFTLSEGPISRSLPWSDPQGANPFADRGLYTWPDAQAAVAADTVEAQGRADDAATLRRLADVPTAIWLTPEAHGRGEVGDHVRRIVADAADADEVAVFVVYGVTDRDCTGQLSAGGLPPEEYAAWVGEIASALGTGDGAAAAVLEPDGLAATFECGNTDQRVELLAGALGSLVDAGVPTYVDAGHSDWRPVDEMADLLRRVGVEKARGFATNVAGYQADADETPYAEALSSRLGGAHYVTDSGRNGAPSTSEWCNPDARLLGDEPAAVDDGSARDAHLWVKPPGESDGTCNGGPDAGVFWVERALSMAAASGW
ncbi:glycoside hydrolase family 6 protein [Nocardioides sp. ChNu-99]|uniref:glycoside hydrolase family 6 protein n=1 Tax=Nocardioides sp. ChNu-99 TaxID=2839897 RepID=UPI002404DC04|nr:glycoside hydrolase family 6 protein [Nocardioides sp. ChNu-99]MDF9716584.1 glycoside hydrolase family 6 protein [Nocardioides sp. ChNu-99]